MFGLGSCTTQAQTSHNWINKVPFHREPLAKAVPVLSPCRSIPAREPCAAQGRDELPCREQGLMHGAALDGTAQPERLHLPAGHSGRRSGHRQITPAHRKLKLALYGRAAPAQPPLLLPRSRCVALCEQPAWGQRGDSAGTGGRGPVLDRKSVV